MPALGSVDISVASIGLDCQHEFVICSVTRYPRTQPVSFYLGQPNLDRCFRISEHIAGVSMNDRLILRNVWVSSSVLALSLFGDALLYVVLPVHAEAFGVSMLMVGFLLAVNRIIRIFAYGVIVQIAERIGVRTLCIIGAITATLSTAGYALFDGVVMLIAARMLWGVSFAALLLVTLTYAAFNRRGPVPESVSVGR